VNSSNGTEPGFHFEVVWDGTVGTFEEVSGLDTETQVIEYRDGNSPVFSVIKMPGIVKRGNVTMKNGRFSAVKQLLALRDQVKMNTIRRMTITIRLLDAEGENTMTWTLMNAWPTKLKNMAQSADGKAVTVESIEFAHEGLTVTNG
jgi:phage tail-like protein